MNTSFATTTKLGAVGALLAAGLYTLPNTAQAGQYYGPQILIDFPAYVAHRIIATPVEIGRAIIQGPRHYHYRGKTVYHRPVITLPHPGYLPQPVLVFPRIKYRKPYHSKHVAWCSKRYKSYRVASNTFQPYKGKRRHCRSPYL